MGSAKQSASARRARAEEMRRAEAARERRNRIIAVTVGVVVLAGMVGGGWAIIASASGDDKSSSSSSSKAPKAEITGEKTFGGLTYNHVSTSVKYKQSPPVGGDHDPTWQDCDGNVYDKPLRNENAVHALEHGAVWVTYTDKATKADVKTLSDKVSKTPYSLMSPYPTQKQGPIVLSAWGHQLALKSASDPRVNQFFKTYVQGEQTREPGAACTGGKATP